jgi:hypothetical protein
VNRPGIRRGPIPCRKDGVPWSDEGASRRPETAGCGLFTCCTSAPAHSWRVTHRTNSTAHRAGPNVRGGTRPGNISQSECNPLVALLWPFQPSGVSGVDGPSSSRLGLALNYLDELLPRASQPQSPGPAETVAQPGPAAAGSSPAAEKPGPSGPGEAGPSGTPQADLTGRDRLIVQNVPPTGP